MDKALHVVFVVSWLADLVTLPRIYVHPALVDAAAARERLRLMARKLQVFMTGAGRDLPVPCLVSVVQ